MTVRDIELAERLARLPDCAIATPAEASALTGFATVTLRKWRRDRRGPRCIKIEGLPRYRLGDLKAFMQAEPSPEVGAE